MTTPRVGRRATAAASPRPARSPDAVRAPQRPTTGAAPDASQRALLVALCAAVVLGAVVRASYTLGADFPLNDGGLFYAMVQDLQAHGYRLPEATSYNGLGIPFAYSPLGFYVAGLVDDVTPFSLLDLFRLLPWLYSVATLGAFALLARRVLHSPVAAVTAVVAFALIPRTFIWPLMGGGVTRGLGLLFAVLALHEVHRLYTSRDRRVVITAGVLCGLTVLSHVETGWFLAFSTFIFWAGCGRTRQSFVHSAILAGIAAAVSSPWWLSVIGQHGLEPFLAATASGGHVFSGGDVTRQALLAVARVTSTSEPLFPLIGVLGLLGVLAAIRGRHYMLPLWWLSIILFDVRAFPTFTSLPVALLAGLAVHEIVLPLSRYAWDRPLGEGRAGEALEAWAPPQWLVVSRGAVVVGGLLLLFATFGSVLRAPGLGGEADTLVGLTQDQRAAFEWVKDNTAPSSQFLVVPRGPWEVDKEGEWFPVLTGRQSVGTVQGLEWTAEFETAVSAYDEAWGCGYELTDCLTRWSMAPGRPFTHVYVPATQRGQCCSTLLDALRRSPFYYAVYDGPGGTIFARAGV